MDATNPKLSPADFLAQLKTGAKAPQHVPSGNANPEELALDFSDLPPAPPAAKGTLATSPALSKGDRTETSGAASEKRPRIVTPPRRGAARSDRQVAPASASPAAVEPAAPAVSPAPEACKSNEYLTALFDRVNSLLGANEVATEGAFFPREPESLEATGMTAEEIERIILKFLLSRGSGSGRRIAQQVCLPFNIVDPLLKSLKSEQLVAFKGAATMGDYEFVPTEMGRERARRYVEECSYFGAAPVALKDYLDSMAAQSIAKQHATEEDLHEAFSDLIISRAMLDKLGPAINSGRGMFLFGEPGNGKTSIAERVTGCFGSSIWIPRCLSIDGDIIRVYDPGVHELIEEATGEGLFNTSGVDQRWVQIRRPTVVVGGELTMAELEVKQNTTTKICEAPLQLKSNCGTLVIDDFGRQRMPVTELLNRWIVPLEKRYDFLNLPCGKKIQVPFDQIIIFSTNLEPRDLVDGAFLRRIPYKIQVPDPTPEDFHKLFQVMAPNLGFKYDAQAIDYLLDTHYRPKERPLRACQPRDLLLQVRNYCLYHELPKTMTPAAFDFACENYFSVM